MNEEAGAPMATRLPGEAKVRPMLYPDTCNYDGLDVGIREAVRVLRAVGVETFESCEGGNGHSYAEPTVRFHGNRSEGWRALAAVDEVALPVRSLRRTWSFYDGEPDGPFWELTFRPADNPFIDMTPPGATQRIEFEMKDESDG